MIKLQCEAYFRSRGSGWNRNRQLLNNNS